MRFFTAPLFLAGVALAQNYGGGGSNNSPTSSSTTSKASSTTAAAANGVQTIVAGQGGNLAYSPNSVTAPVGSIVEFQFAGPGHTVTSAAFDSPCVGNSSSIFSGVIGSGGASNIASNTFQITINDTNPIWFYCAIPTHCQAGMVGVINPPASGNTLQTFQSNAKKAGTSFTPSTVQGGIVGPAKAATPPSSSSSSSTSASSSPTKTPTGAASFSTGSISWVAVAVTGIAAWGFGSLLM